MLQNKLDGFGALCSVCVTTGEATKFIAGASLPCMFVWTIKERFQGEFISVDIWLRA